MRSLRTCAALADYDVAGFERQSVNDLALGLPWKVDAAWTWPKQVHINILESAVLCRLYKEVAIAHRPCRFVAPSLLCPLSGRGVPPRPASAMLPAELR